MKCAVFLGAAAQLSAALLVSGFTNHVPLSTRIRGVTVPPPSKSILSSLAGSASAPKDEGAQVSRAVAKKEEHRKLIRKEGGLFAFDTKYGALNPYSIYYGFLAIFLGIPWFLALTICDVLYKITGNRFDRQVKNNWSFSDDTL